MTLFEQIHANGNTLIIVTHEDDISRHAHRIVRLKDGEISSDLKNEIITRNGHHAQIQ
jgi:putative ABC transport system ATP-binding protein